MSHGSDTNLSLGIKPVIAELLRTCVHPPILVLRVEHIIRQHTGPTPAESHTSREQDDGPSNDHATRLFLTDGKLLIQALLHRKVSSLSHSRDIVRGDLVEIYSFEVKKARRNSGQGHVLYLGIKDCRFIACDSEKAGVSGTSTLLTARDSTTGPKRKRISPEREDDLGEDIMAGGFVREDDNEGGKPLLKKVRTEQDVVMPKITNTLGQNSMKSPAEENKNTDSRVGDVGTASPNQAPSKSTQPAQKILMNPKDHAIRPVPDPLSDEEDAFETIHLNEDTIKKRRHALHELSQSTIPSSDQRNLTKLTTSSRPSSSRSNAIDITRAPPPILPPTTSSATTTTISTPQSRPPSAHNPNPTLTPILQQPPPEPPFHTLLSILHPPPTDPLPQKNYTFTTLAIITYINPSLITKPNTPFPPKRHIKIEDPSLHLPPHPTSHSSSSSSLLEGKRGKGLTISIYDSAITFKPTFGTLALFRGLVMQRLRNGDVVLNIYPRRKAINRTLRNDEDVMDDKLASKRGKGDDTELGFEEGEWFITDQVRLRKMGYGKEIDGVKGWWDVRSKELGRLGGSGKVIS